MRIYLEHSLLRYSQIAETLKWKMPPDDIVIKAIDVGQEAFLDV